MAHLIFSILNQFLTETNNSQSKNVSKSVQRQYLYSMHRENKWIVTPLDTIIWWYYDNVMVQQSSNSLK